MEAKPRWVAAAKQLPKSMLKTNFEKYVIALVEWGIIHRILCNGEWILSINRWDHEQYRY